MAGSVYGAGNYGAGIYGSADPTVDSPTTVETPNNPGFRRPDPLLLVGTNGDVIPIGFMSDDYVAESGASGIGIPPRVLTMFEGAADGATVRYTRTTARDIDLPIGIFGTSRGNVGDKQRRLAAALRPRPGKADARLQFTLEGGDQYETVIHYVAGAETKIGTEGTAVYCRWPITFRCPDPYWTALDETVFRVSAGGSHRGLLPQLSRLRLASAQVLGNVTIMNDGDVEADIVWDITGPGGPFSAVDETGASFAIDDTLDAGERITIDTATGAVTDQTGANRYSSLGDAPKLFKLPDGLSTLQISMTGATSASSVTGRYRARREIVY